MKLLGVEYGSIFCAVGARGFYGEGYPIHRYTRPTWEGMGFTAKTGTMERHAGNMPVIENIGSLGITPLEFYPRCILVKPLSGHILNAVKLSNPGFPFLLEKGIWQELKKPFFLSFATVGSTRNERMEETREFTALLSRHLPFRAPVGLQLNYGCPNVDLNLDEIGEALDITGELTDRFKVTVFVNFSVVADPKIMIETANHPYDAGLWDANTIPWGYAGIDWKKIFGTNESPMESRGFDTPGGLSGPSCLPFAELRVKQMRAAGVTKPIVVGNGIQRPRDVVRLQEAGADAIAVGSVALVRPWRMRAIIREAHNVRTREETG